MVIINHRVVYRTIPTSNHNSWFVRPWARLLYIVLFLHQTTTGPSTQSSRYWLYIVLFLHQTTTTPLFDRATEGLYIVLFLHQTTTIGTNNLAAWWLYIVLFLHQTTTYLRSFSYRDRCISYYSYIKPQLSLRLFHCVVVVYRTIPTSNHNLWHNVYRFL